MKLKSLTILILAVVLTLPVLALGQDWNEEQIEQARTVLGEKFQLEESLSFNQEGVLETETVQVYPATVEVTDEGLEEGLTLALAQYGEETFLPIFVASIPESEPPYGFALMNQDGEVVAVGPVELEGVEEGPESPEIELVNEKEDAYRVALKFAGAKITIDVPKNSPLG